MYFSIKDFRYVSCRFEVSFAKFKHIINMIKIVTWVVKWINYDQSIDSFCFQKDLILTQASNSTN